MARAEAATLMRVAGEENYVLERGAACRRALGKAYSQSRAGFRHCRHAALVATLLDANHRLRGVLAIYGAVTQRHWTRTLRLRAVVDVNAALAKGIGRRCCRHEGASTPTLRSRGVSDVAEVLRGRGHQGCGREWSWMPTLRSRGVFDDVGRRSPGMTFRFDVGPAFAADLSTYAAGGGADADVAVVIAP